jgi:hypothetical protein
VLQHLTRHGRSSCSTRQRQLPKQLQYRLVPATRLLLLLPVQLCHLVTSQVSSLWLLLILQGAVWLTVCLLQHDLGCLLLCACRNATLLLLLHHQGDIPLLLLLVRLLLLVLLLWLLLLLSVAQRL